MYHHILYSLAQPVLDRISDFLDAVEPRSDAYQGLKDRLLKKYEVSAFKHIPRLKAIPPLSGKSPPDLLTAMLKLCPPRDQGALLFRDMFYSCLPRWMQLWLPHHETQPLREMALREMALQADGLVAGGRPDSHPVAAVEQQQEPAPVAADEHQHRGSRRGRQRGRYQRSRYQCDGQKRKTGRDGCYPKPK